MIRIRTTYLSIVEERGVLAHESAAHEAAYTEALAAQLESLAAEIGTGGDRCQQKREK